MPDDAQIKHQTTGLPFVTLKLAQTLDGNIATDTGDSKWITSEASRKRGHQLRAAADAIMVGRGTIIADDPELSVRYVTGDSPTKIVLDSQLQTPLSAQVFDGAPLVIATSQTVCQDRVQHCKDKGAQVWQVPTVNEQLDLIAVLQKAVGAGFLRILIEGGSQLAASALGAGVVDRLAVFVAPKILGLGLPSVGAMHISSVADAIALEDIDVEIIGNDFLYTACVKSNATYNG